MRRTRGIVHETVLGSVVPDDGRAGGLE
ncbi:MAG: hypothetical protein QOC92_2273, partial [Acidimicrobiaceae bacterium]